MTRQKAFLELWLQEMKMGKNKTQMSFMNGPKAETVYSSALWLMLAGFALLSINGSARVQIHYLSM